MFTHLTVSPRGQAWLTITGSQETPDVYRKNEYLSGQVNDWPKTGSDTQKTLVMSQGAEQGAGHAVGAPPMTSVVGKGGYYGGGGDNPQPRFKPCLPFFPSAARGRGQLPPQPGETGRWQVRREPAPQQPMFPPRVWLSSPLPPPLPGARATAAAGGEAGGEGEPWTGGGESAEPTVPAGGGLGAGPGKGRGLNPAAVTGQPHQCTYGLSPMNTTVRPTITPSQTAHPHTYVTKGTLLQTRSLDTQR